MTFGESFSAFLSKIEVKPEGDVGKVDRLKNKDLIPMGPERRIWGIFSFASYWGVSNLCLSAWTGGSSLLSLGMNVGETMGVIVVGNFIIAVIALMNGAPGGYYHIGFTVSQRMIFGIRGSYFGIAMRTILSVVWYASQAWQGGLCLGMILSSWSHSYLTMKNTFPESVHMSRRDCVSFFLFQLISIPLLLIKPEKINKFTIIANIASFFGMLGIICWAVKDAGGNGPLMSNPDQFTSTSAHAWAWIYGITSWYGSVSAGITNQADFTRFSTRTWISIPGTVFSVVVIGSIVPLMGMITASATYGKYGVEYWNVYDILELWLKTNYSSKARAGAFFAGVVFVLSQLGINIMGNGYAGGMDMAGLFPRYINIRRGAVITALLSWVIQPWDFYNTSSTFVTVMSSFSVFMSPVIGIIISEFWIIRNKKLKLSDLYSNDPNGSFWYYRGFNYKGLISFTVACAPGIPGLVNAANPSLYINNGIKHYYDGNCIFGLLVAMFLNYVLNLAFPSKDIGEVDSVDYFNTFTEQECEKLGLVPFHLQESNSEEEIEYIKEQVPISKEE